VGESTGLETEVTVRIALLDDYQRIAKQMAAWEATLPDDELVALHEVIPDRDQLVDRLESFDAIVAMRERTTLDAELIAHLPRLRLIVSTGRRNVAIDAEAARRVGVTVCGTDTLGRPPVELTWALILSLVRRLPAETASVQVGGWQVGVGGDLFGRTLGVVGLGRLGADVARIGTAFGMSVIAWSPRLTEERAAAAGAQLVSRDDLFALSDVVSLHAKLTPESKGMVGRAELATMKETAYLVNTSRGDIIDEPALVEALRSGEIAGAALDVFAHEPLPVEHPLRRTQRLLLTPHIGYVTRDNYQLMYGQALEQVVAFKTGRPVRHLSS
jgi:phosphoglycerate dehydrogenase-like enzyme